jgi:hypothetical protein
MIQRGMLLLASPAPRHPSSEILFASADAQLQVLLPSHTKHPNAYRSTMCSLPRPLWEVTNNGRQLRQQQDRQQQQQQQVVRTP